MYSLPIFIGHMDNRTQRRTKLLMDNQQLSNSNFNNLLKCILYLFSLDIWTNGHTNKINFYWTTTSCPILTSIFFSNVLCIVLIGRMDNRTHRQTQLLMDNHQLSNSNLNILPKCIPYLFSFDTWTTGHTDEHNS